MPTIAGSIQKSESASDYSVVFFIILVSSTIIGISNGRSAPRYLKKTLRLGPKGWILSIVTGTGLAIYYLCLYHALLNYSQAQEYVLNYLWPIFYLLIAAIPIGAKRAREEISIMEWILVGMAFLGALIALVDISSFTMIATRGHVFAVIGAFFAAAYLRRKRPINC